MIVDKEAHLGTLPKAYGLTLDEAKMLNQLVNVFSANLRKNEERMAYYEDKKRVSFPGINLRREMQGIRTDVGWCAKGVDLLAARSVFDGFTVNGEQDEELSKTLSDCDFAAEYARAVPTQLVYGFGLWTVSRGGDGEPSAIIRYHAGDECSALWDYRRNRLKCAMTIVDYELDESGERMTPNFVNLYTDDYLVELVRMQGASEWSVNRKPNFMGRPMAVQMVYRPNSKPLGKSRISKAAMRITDNMRREIFLMNVQSRFYSLPTKYMLNASEELMDSIDKTKVYNDEMLVVGKDADGETVTIGQLQAASPGNHIDIMTKLALDMSAEFGLPASTFGADTTKTYTSSEALRANQDEIILEARQLNRDNGKSLRVLAQMVLAIVNNEPLKTVNDGGRDVDVLWVDPAMPSASQRADALVKQVSMMPWLAETDEILKQLDYDEPTRMRLMRQKADAQAAVSLNAILMGGVEVPADADTAPTA